MVVEGFIHGLSGILEVDEFSALLETLNTSETESPNLLDTDKLILIATEKVFEEFWFDSSDDADECNNQIELLTVNIDGKNISKQIQFSALFLSNFQSLATLMISYPSNKFALYEKSSLASFYTTSIQSSVLRSKLKLFGLNQDQYIVDDYVDEHELLTNLVYSGSFKGTFPFTTMAASAMLASIIFASLLILHSFLFSFLWISKVSVRASERYFGLENGFLTSLILPAVVILLISSILTFVV